MDGHAPSFPCTSLRLKIHIHVRAQLAGVNIDLDPTTYIWNLLEENVVLRATEVGVRGDC